MGLNALNQAVKELNGRSPYWNFLRVTDSITPVAATATYSLSTNFNKVSKAQLIDTDSNEYRPLTYYDWEAFQDYVHRQTATGNPEIYTSKNFYDTGKVEFYPVPDAGTVTDFTIDVAYYKRLGTLTDSTTSLLTAPEEVEPWVVARGQTILASIKDMAKYAMFRGESLKLWGELIAYDRRQTDERPRFTLRGRNVVTGATLIKVGDGYIVV